MDNLRLIKVVQSKFPDAEVRGIIHEALLDLGFKDSPDENYPEEKVFDIYGNIYEKIEQKIKERDAAIFGDGRYVAYTLPQTGTWFKAKYAVQERWIEAVPGSSVSSYNFEEKLDSIVNDLKKLGEILEGYEKNLNDPINNLPKKAINGFVRFFDNYGPLGIKLRGIYEYIFHPIGGTLLAIIHPCEDMGVDVKRYLKDWLKDEEYRVKPAKTSTGPAEPSSETREDEFSDETDDSASSYTDEEKLWKEIEDFIEAGERGELKEYYNFEEERYLLAYREEIGNVAQAIIDFYRIFSTGLRGDGDNMPDELNKSLHYAKQVIKTRSRVPLAVRIYRYPNSLIDAAYLHMVEMLVRGGARICADPKCGRIFQLEDKVGRRKMYCSRSCSDRYRKERQRQRQRSGEKES